VINFQQLSTLPHYASGMLRITGSYLLCLLSAIETYLAIFQQVKVLVAFQHKVYNTNSTKRKGVLKNSSGMERVT
jgi:hypothetical protein